LALDFTIEFALQASSSSTILHILFQAFVIDYRTRYYVLVQYTGIVIYQLQFGAYNLYLRVSPPSPRSRSNFLRLLRLVSLSSLNLRMSCRNSNSRLIKPSDSKPPSHGLTLPSAGSNLYYQSSNLVLLGPTASFQLPQPIPESDHSCNSQSWLAVAKPSMPPATPLITLAPPTPASLILEQ
jgi:hypothetical protein